MLQLDSGQCFNFISSLCVSNFTLNVRNGWVVDISYVFKPELFCMLWYLNIISSRWFQRPSAKELLKHRFIRNARKSPRLLERIRCVVFVISMIQTFLMKCGYSIWSWHWWCKYPYGLFSDIRISSNEPKKTELWFSWYFMSRIQNLWHRGIGKFLKLPDLDIN